MSYDSASAGFAGNIYTGKTTQIFTQNTCKPAQLLGVRFRFRAPLPKNSPHAQGVNPAKSSLFSHRAKLFDCWKRIKYSAYSTSSPHRTTHMASITKTSSGYRAQVYVKGARDTKCFRTRREAAAWAAVREAELRAEAGKTPTERHTLRAAIERYRADVSPTKRGARWEKVRLTAFLDSPILPIDSTLAEVTPDILGKWRDSRLQQVSAGTVLREFGLLSAVFEEARREWRWVAINPVSDVRKPRQPDHREVVLTRRQIKAMLKSLGYSPTRPIRTVSQAVAAAFLLALRTGMREGEICGLTWERIHEGYCQTPHKTGAHGTSLRDVPLTPKAKRIINKMRGFDRDTVFGVGVQSLGTLFRRARVRAGMEGFTFHDARHTAATWLAQRLHILDLCKMFGWKGTKQAMVYFNPKASDIAKRIG